MINKYLLDSEVYEKIPALIDGVWTEISFESKQSFIDVGKYDLDESSNKVLDIQKSFLVNGEYNSDEYGSKGYIDFWDFEKLKCRKGIFIISGNKCWYFSAVMYFWLNFLPIYNKKRKKDTFPELTDAHIRMDLYEFIAELRGEHAVVTKKRQFGSSYYHAAKLIRAIWFDPSVILQMGASLEKYIHGRDGTWRYINSYRNWLNSKTAWYRHFEGGDGSIQQVREEKDTVTNQTVKSGRMGILTATTFERSATNGVGGPKTYFYHEEGGVAPKMDSTYEFMRPALEDGTETTGQFIVAGSVGDLQACEPLRKYMYNPGNGFYFVENDLVEEGLGVIETGLFISEIHAMSGFVDQYGNSDVEGALIKLEADKKQWAKNLDPELYALRCSQKPTYLNEAFKFRGESEMPVILLQAEEKIIERGEYPCEYVDLEYDIEDPKLETVKATISKKTPIVIFPLSPRVDSKEKEGVIVCWERPIKNLIPLSTYYISIDPVGQGKTVTSKSLCSIIVYRNAHFVCRKVNGVEENVIEGGYVVCTWTGRFDDIEDTHDRLIKIMLWYKGWTLCENNVTLFINEVRERNLQRFLVSRKSFQFATEIDNQHKTHFYEYGWRNTGTIFDKHLKDYLVKFLKETIQTEVDENGNSVVLKKGVSRVRDVMAIKEMIGYYKGLNVDRIVTLAALVTLVELQKTQRRGNLNHVYEDEVLETNLESSAKLSKLNSSPFNNLGKTQKMNGLPGSKRSFFKNLGK